MFIILNCGFDLCIYWEENHCIFDSIKINELGMCDSCIIVAIEEEYLKKKRLELRKNKNPCDM